ncbi:MAG: DNA polymerase I [Desulfovibrionaceae bacterium]
MPLKEKTKLIGEPLYLVDGSSFLYRGFYAYPDLARSDGFPTNAIFIVLRILLRVLREERPRYLGFILDGKGPTFRNELYGEYKANRPRMPEPLAQQIEPLKEAVRLLGVPLTVSDGVEADDCIASLAMRYRDDRSVVILGSDKDLKQCLHENVLLWNPAGKQESVTTLADFTAETGLSPAQWPDFQAVIGDSSDNIPGIPGVGPKTAEKIFADYPTLEDIRENYASLKPKLAEKVGAHLDDIFLFRELTRMKTDCDCGEGIESYSLAEPDRQAMDDFLREYEFRSLRREFSGMFPARDAAEAASSTGAAAAAKAARPAKESASGPGQVQLGLFAEAPAQEEGEPLEITDIADSADLPDMALLDVGVVLAEGEIRLGVAGREYRYAEPVAPLAAALAGAACVVAPDVHELYRADEAWREVPLAKWFDLALAAYLLNPEERNYAWDRLRDALFTPDPAFEGTEPPETHPRAQGLAALAYRQLVAPRIQAAGLLELMTDLETPLVPVLDAMERRGVTLDLEAFSGFLDEVSGGIDRLTAAIHEKAGGEFNIRSSQQLGEVLFEHLGLKPGGKTTGGQLSTAVQVLEKIRSQHPIVEDILQFRTLEKLRSTYLEPLPKMVDEAGRIHTHFNRLATATGRLSSSGPNLQNIPIRGQYGPRMRACFTAAPGQALVGADYSQVELRVLAHFSKDPALVSAFADDEDIHSRTAALIFDKDSPGAVTREERQNAKTINFGLIYGMGPQRLARELGVTLTTAKEFIDRYFERLGTLKAFYETVVAEATASGHVTTLAGRRRLLPELASRNQQLVSQARRQAVNTVIQGSAADIIKLAMLRVHADEALAGLGARMLLQVHDELLLEAPEAAAPEAAGRLASLMQSVTELAVPLKVDAGTGRTWADAH